MGNDPDPTASRICSAEQNRVGPLLAATLFALALCLAFVVAGPIVFALLLAATWLGGDGVRAFLQPASPLEWGIMGRSLELLTELSLIPMVVWVTAVFCRRVHASSGSFAGFWKPVGIGILITLAGAAGLLSLGLYGAVQGLSPVAGVPTSSPTLVLLSIATIGLQALREELVFRGYLLATLRHAVGPGAAVLLTSAAFAATHFIRDAPTAQRVVELMALGCLFAYAALRFGSILPSFALHFGSNIGVSFAVFGTFLGPYAGSPDMIARNNTTAFVVAELLALAALGAITATVAAKFGGPGGFGGYASEGSAPRSAGT